MSGLNWLNKLLREISELLLPALYCESGVDKYDYFFYRTRIKNFIMRLLPSSAVASSFIKKVIDKTTLFIFAPFFFLNFFYDYLIQKRLFTIFSLTTLISFYLFCPLAKPDYSPRNPLFSQSMPRGRSSYSFNFDVSVLIDNSRVFFIVLLFTYILSLVYMTISTGFFGIHGVYVFSFINLFLLWFNQLLMSQIILIDGRKIAGKLFGGFKIFGNVQLEFELCIDLVSYSFMFLTTSIGLVAVAYALTYFKNEPNADRFILLLNWFIVSMIILVIADNAILLFLG